MRAVVSGAVAAAAVLACSGIPDLRFVDADAGIDGSSADAAADAATDSAPDASDFSCPARPPPAAIGVCCSSGELCLGCAEPDDCSDCGRENCNGALVCCKGPGSSMRCTSQRSCR